MAIINGWGRGAWNEGAWGTALPVEPSSVGAITSGLGTVTDDAEANVTFAGRAITSALGSVIVHENEVINMPSFAVTSAIGAVTTVAKANVVPPGQSGTVSLSSVLVYGEIDTSQTPNFSDVTTTQTPNYSDVATTQTPNYTTIKGGRDAA